MWIFTKYGFYSAVCARQGDGKQSQPVDPTRLMVRARVRQHLVNLTGHFPAELGDCQISETGHTDYAFRIFVAKEIWSSVLTQLAKQTDYDNFKGAVGKEQEITGKDYIQALHDVWEVMHKLHK